MNTATLSNVENQLFSLTDSEERDRLFLERKVERAFFEAGKALAQLRDKRLYRSTHRTFEEYCRERFGYTRRRPYQLIDAAAVVENLTEKCEQFVHILPARESQVRPLTNLEPQQQVEVWSEAVSEAGNKVPSARIVKSVVERIRELNPVPFPYQVGEVCQILAKGNPDLRGKSGCWAIVTKVYEYSCDVQVWNGVIELVKPENLKDLEYSSTEQQLYQALSNRLLRLQAVGVLGAAAKAVLKEIGRLEQPYLDREAEALLRFLEQHYGIE